MQRLLKYFVVLIAICGLASLSSTGAEQSEKRIALVIGNASYQAGALATAANDAGLIAQTLQAAGFDVVGARDLDQDSLRRSFRDFLEKAMAAGPNTVAFIYGSGYGVQLGGENYFVPIDAKIARDIDVTVETLRISDYIRPLAALKLKASIVVLDAARANPFAKTGSPLAGGLALVDPEPGMLIAFNAAPGTVAPEGQGPYGPYAQALAEMIREGGLPLPDVFDRARLRVNDVTKGAELPWHASRIETSVVFFERAPDSPPPAVSAEQAAVIRAKPIRELAIEEAYAAALERDTLEGYSDFVAAYPRDPLAKRVRAIIAARREAVTWRRTCLDDTPSAYWTYLRRYPDGPHAPDARRRLAFLAAALEPPPSFAEIAYDVPPPPPEEVVYIRRPVLVFDDPELELAPPPPAPIVFLAPPPPEFVVLPPPPPSDALFVLPMPVYTPVPVWVRPPEYVTPPPPNNVIFNNVHNTVVVNNVTNTATVTNPNGQTTTIAPPATPTRTPGGRTTARPTAAPIGPALPPSVAQKAALQSPALPGAGTKTGAQGSPRPSQPGQPLPGMKGQPPLPAAKSIVSPSPPESAARPAAPLPPPGGSPQPNPATPTAKLGANPPATLRTAPGLGVGGMAKPETTKPAGKVAVPTPPTGTAKPATSPPSTLPPGAVRPAPRPAALSPPHPSIAARPPVQAAPPRPAAPPPAVAARPPVQAAAAPQARGGCPPGKTMAVVNGHPTCK
jgi:uncharacterized caspase-like protein